MRILLDSHVFVWFLLGDRKCKAKARDLIGRSDVTAYVSAATAWELATKARIGKWQEASTIIHNLVAIMADHDFTGLPVGVEHGRIAGLYTSPHKDPFDRMLAAQSQSETMPLVTADPKFLTFGIETIW